jgi:phosphate transport system permease protein
MLTIDDLQGNRKRRNRERSMRRLFQVAAIVSIVISALILFTLFRGTFDFFSKIDWDFSKLKDTGWFPRRSRYDLSTIIVGSIVIGLISLIVAVPFGLGVAVYLSEYASRRVRTVVKPVIELLAGMPSVVVGYFALTFISPEITQQIFSGSRDRNMLLAGLGIGILVIPIMASVSEDALRSVPGSCQEGHHRHQGGAAGRRLGARGGVHHRRLPGDR